MVEIISAKITELAMGGMTPTVPKIVFDSSVKWSSIENSFLMKKMRVFGNMIVPISEPEDVDILLCLTTGGHSAAEIASSLTSTTSPFDGKSSVRAGYQSAVKRVISMHHAVAHAGMRSADDIDGSAATATWVPFEFEFELPAKGYVFDSREMFDIWGQSLGSQDFGAGLINLAFRAKGVILND